MRVPFHKASITQEDEQAVLEVLRSGWLTTGNVTLEFEKLFSESVETPSIKEKRGKVISLAVNSNTSGMILAMEACGVKEGTAVITTPYTFVSTAACARHLNADVYFADIEGTPGYYRYNPYSSIFNEFKIPQRENGNLER